MGKMLPVWPREIKVTHLHPLISSFMNCSSVGRGGSIHQKNKTKPAFLYIQSSESISLELGVRASLKRRKGKSAEPRRGKAN